MQLRISVRGTGRSFIGLWVRLSRVIFERRTDQGMDGPTIWQTDKWTDTTSFKDAYSRGLKLLFQIFPENQIKAFFQQENYHFFTETDPPR